MKNKLKSFKDYLINLIYPNHIKCIFCGDELNQNSYNDTCEDCFETLPFISHCCDRCGDKISEDSFVVCNKCKNINYDFIKARSVFEYNDKLIKAVHGFKYADKKYLYKPFAKFLAEYYSTNDMFADYVVCVPMFKTKEEARGYNQAKLLAEEFSNITKVPFVDCCSKIVDNESQTTLNFKNRQQNVANTFAFNNKYKKKIKDKSILVIDDIFTTGATSNEVCKLLKENGAKECYVLTLAHTTLDARPF